MGRWVLHVWLFPEVLCRVGCLLVVQHIASQSDNRHRGNQRWVKALRVIGVRTHREHRCQQIAFATGQGVHGSNDSLSEIINDLEFLSWPSGNEPN